MYKTNFIKEVVVRLDFPAVLPLKKVHLRKFRDSLKISDLEYKEEVTNSFILNFGNPQKTKLKSEGLKGSFLINNGEKNFYLESTAFSYNTFKYEKKELLFDDLENGLKSLENTFKDLNVKRIGLRIVNQLKLDSIKKLSDWRNFINNDYISNYGESLPSGYENFIIRRKWNTVWLSDGIYFLKVNVGIWNDNFPGTIKDKGEFIIDLDCYIDNLILDINEVRKHLPIMCDTIYRFFDYIILEKLKR